MGATLLNLFYLFFLKKNPLQGVEMISVAALIKAFRKVDVTGCVALRGAMCVFPDWKNPPPSFFLSPHYTLPPPTTTPHPMSRH